MSFNLPIFQDREAIIHAEKGLYKYNIDLDQCILTNDIQSEGVNTAKFNSLDNSNNNNNNNNGICIDNMKYQQEKVHNEENFIEFERKSGQKDSIMSLNSKKNSLNFQSTYDEKLKDDYAIALKELEIVRHEKCMSDQKTTISQQRIEELENENENLQNKVSKLKNKYITKKNQLLHYKTEYEVLNKQYKKDMNIANLKYYDLQKENMRLNEELAFNEDEMNKMNMNMKGNIKNDESKIKDGILQCKQDTYETENSYSKLNFEFRKLQETQKLLQSENISLLNHLANIETKYSGANNLLNKKLEEAYKIIDECKCYNMQISKTSFYKQKYSEAQVGEYSMKMKNYTPLKEIKNIEFKVQGLEKDQLEISESKEDKDLKMNFKSEELSKSVENNENLDDDCIPIQEVVSQTKTKRKLGRGATFQNQEENLTQESEYSSHFKFGESIKDHVMIDNLKTQLALKDKEFYEMICEYDSRFEEIYIDYKNLKEEYDNLKHQIQNYQIEINKLCQEKDELKSEIEKINKRNQQTSINNLELQIKNNQKIIDSVINDLKKKENLQKIRNHERKSNILNSQIKELNQCEISTMSSSLFLDNIDISNVINPNL